MTDVARGQIVIDLDDRASAAMKKVQGEVKSALSSISREEAVAKVDANIAPLKRELREAKADLEKFRAEEKRLSENATAQDRKEARENVKNAETRKKALDRQIAGQNEYKSALQQSNREKRLSEQRTKALSDAETKAAKIREDNNNRAIKAETELEKARSDAYKEDRKRNADSQRDAQRMGQIQARANTEYQRRVDQQLEGERQLAIAQQRAIEMDQKRTQSSEKNRRDEAVMMSKAQDMDRQRSMRILQEQQQIETLRQRYGQLYQEQIKNNKAAGSTRSRLERAAASKRGETEIPVDVDGRRIALEMEAIRAKIKLLAKDPVEIPVVAQEDERGFAKSLGFLSKIKNARVNVGPVSGSLGGFAIALSALAPIITGLVGAAGALTASLGAGLVGALGAGAAAATGFGLAALGIGLVMRPMVKDIQAVFQAQSRYNKAVNQFGSDSPQAEKKLKQLNNTLGAVSPEAKKAFRDFGNVSAAWGKFSKQMRPQVFDDLGQGLKTVNALMPMFEANTAQALTAVSAGWQQWMKGLRGAEAQNILAKIGGNFNKMIPGLLSGLGSLATFVGRIGASFSRFLPGLGNQFSAWAKGLADGVSNSSKLDVTVNKLMTSFQAILRLGGSLSNLIKEVFAPGITPGNNFIDDMSNSLDNLNAKLATTGGQRGLRDFFEQGIDTTKRFWNALTPVLSTFVAWSNAFRPFTDSLLAAVTLLGKFTSAIANMAAGRAIIQSLVYAFVVAKIASFFSALVSGTKEAIAALTSLRAVMLAVNTASAVGGGPAGVGGMGALNTATAGAATAATGAAAKQRATSQAIKDVEAAAAGAAASTTKYGGALSKLGSFARSAGGPLAAAAAALLLFGSYAAQQAGQGRTGPIGAVGTQINNLARSASDLDRGGNKGQAFFAGLTSGLDSAMPGLGSAVAGIGQLVGLQSKADRQQAGFAANLARSSKFFQAFGRAGLIAGQQMDQSESQLANTYIAVGQSAMNVKSAEQAVAAARRSGGKSTDEYKQAILNLQAARLQDAQITQQWASLQTTSATNAAKAVAGARATMQQALQQGNLPAAIAAQRAYNVALNQQAAVASNVARAQKGLINVTGIAEQKLGSLARKGGQKVAQKVAVNFEANDVGKVASSASAALKRGVSASKIEAKIEANPGDALAAIRAIDRLKIKDKNVKVTGDTRDGDTKLRSINAKKVNGKVVSVSGNTRAADSKLNTIDGRKLKGKTVVADGNTAPGMAKMNTFQGRVNSLQGKTVTLNAVANTSGISGFLGMLAAIPSQKVTQLKTVSSGGKMKGGVVFGAASGISPNEMRTMDRAQARAEKKAPRPATSQKVNSATLLTGEEGRTEYVIATNPAYRASNEKYLGMAANELGYGLVSPDGSLLTAASKGTATKKGVAQAKSTIKRFIPPKLADYVGPVDTGDIETQVNNSKGAWTDIRGLRKERLADLAQYNKEKRAWSRKSRKNRGAAPQKPLAPPTADEVTTAKAKYDKLNTFLKTAKLQVQKFADEENRIDALRSAMQEADNNTKFVTTTNPITGVKTGSIVEGLGTYEGKKYSFGQLQGLRKGLINDRNSLLQTAINDFAAVPSAKSSAFYTKLLSALGTGVVDAQENLGLTTQAAGDKGQFDQGVIDDQAQLDKQAADDKAAALKEIADRQAEEGSAYGVDPTQGDEYQGALDRALANIAVAQVNDTPDDPTTPYVNEAATTAADNVPAQQALVDFWRGVYGRIGPNGDPIRLKNAATEYKSALDELRTATDTVNAPATTTLGEQMSILSNSRADLLKAFGSNMASSSFMPLPSTSASPGVGAFGPNTSTDSGGTSVHVTNHFAAPPSDPHTWSNTLGWELQHAI